jgi:L-lysine 2,3-aminomutase
MPCSKVPRSSLIAQMKVRATLPALVGGYNSRFAGGRNPGREHAMIPATGHAPQQDSPSDWRQSLREAITDPHELLALLDLAHLADRLPAGDAGFALKVPRGFAARMRRGDRRDPLLLQVLPQLAEFDDVQGFTGDAVGDLDASVGHGVLRKYDGRALLIAAGSCAVNCRYCFRRHFPYGGEIAATSGWRQAIDCLRRDPSIREVILSGGDPLVLSTQKLTEFTCALSGLPHVMRLRIHSRLPVVLPERVDSALLDWLLSLPLQRVVVLHSNHPDELDASVGAACARLREVGATLLNQSVLLRGVNDDAGVLAELSERLFAFGVIPYYLHQLDRVRGAAHFEVPDERARTLAGMLRARLPGYLVPRLVREVPGEASKHPL